MKDGGGGSRTEGMCEHLVLRPGLQMAVSCHDSSVFFNLEQIIFVFRERHTFEGYRLVIM